METEWIAKYEVDWNYERSAGEVRPPLFPTSKQFRGRNSFRGESVIPAYFISVKLFRNAFLRYKNRILLTVWVKLLSMCLCER